MDIAVTTILLFAVFGILLFVGCPISVSIVVSSIVTALSSLSWDQITFITMQKMNGGVESFSLRRNQSRCDRHPQIVESVADQRNQNPRYKIPHCLIYRISVAFKCNISLQRKIDTLCNK